MKRILPFLIVLSSSLWSHCGFHVGGGIGVLTNVVSFEQTAPGATTAPDDNAFFSTSQRADICHTNLWGELYLGYGLTFCRCLFGEVRFGANFTTGELTAESAFATPLNRTSLTASIQTNHVEPTLDLRGGFTPCFDLYLFALSGVAYNRVELTQKRMLSREEIVRPFSTASNVVGWRVGLGFEKLFCCRFGLNFAYIHTFYPTRHHTQLLPVAPQENIFLPQTLKARLSRRIATAGLSCYF
jgi:hypothetical protein